MKQIIRSPWLSITGLLLALPTAYFFCIAILKYELNIDAPFDTIAPFLERMGISEPLGWNINLLILFGPVIGFLLAACQVLSIRWEFSKEEFRFHFTVRKNWFPILVAGFSTSLVAFLFLYMLGENCHC